MKLTHYLWLLPFISFLGGYFLLARLYHRDTIPTPALVGITLQEAFPIVSEHHLNIRLLAFKQDPDLADGTIVSQTPIATTQIKPNQTIHVVLSQKPAKPIAPYLLNKHADVISKELKNAGIGNKSYMLQSTQPSHTCIGQFPQAGTLLEEKKIITYFASEQRKPVLIPHFKGTSITAVTDFLTHHGCTYTITHADQPVQNHICVPSCTVIDQRPLPYSIVMLSPIHPLQVHLHVQHAET